MQPYLVDVGVDIRLLGGGGIRSVLPMSGPSTSVLGLVVVGWAIWRARFRPEWRAAIPVLVLIPLAGFWNQGTNLLPRDDGSAAVRWLASIA